MQVFFILFSVYFAVYQYINSKCLYRTHVKILTQFKQQITYTNKPRTTARLCFIYISNQIATNKTKSHTIPSNTRTIPTNTITFAPSFGQIG